MTKKKLKVAIIHPALGKTTGGSQVFVLELAQRLKEKVNLTILSGTRVNELCKPVFSVTRGWKTGKFLRRFFSKPDIVIEHLSSFLPVFFDLMINDYDLIFPNNDWGGLLVASIVKKIKGTPVIFTEHLGFMENGKMARRNLKFKPDKYIALSRDFRDWVTTNYPEISVEYIPNGVDFSRFNPDVKPTNIDLPGKIVLTAGRNQKNKRLNLVIDAVSKLDNVSLLMLSSGESIESLEKLGRDKIGEKRFRLMKVRYEEIPSYYRACDVFTLPSEQEPFGLVYLEALACNRPVVAPNDLSRADIIGKAGFLGDLADTNEYAGLLENALNADFKDEPFKQARPYTWKLASEKYLNAFDEIITTHN